jgi:hypothetical protein
MHAATSSTGTSDGALPLSNETTSDSKGWSAFCVRHPNIIALAVLAIIVGVEFINFGAAYRKTGFYLDDWLMLRQLSFGPQGYFDLIYKYLTTDPRVIIRPIEALHFGSVFYFSGIDPFGWRLSNLIMEVASAFFIYLIVARLALSRVLAFFSSMFFLTYPVHDSTHYWAVCSCVSLSLTLYLASLWTTLRAVAAKNKLLWLISAYGLFALSIYGYEPFLPLCALNVVAFILGTSDVKRVGLLFKPAVIHSLPYAAVIASLLVYQRYIVPLIMKAALHKIHFDPGLLLSTIGEGLRVVSPIATVPYISNQVSQFMQNEGFSTAVLIRLLLVVALVAIGMVLTMPGSAHSRKLSVQLILLGAFTTVISYSIFGLNPEYTPTLITLVNRINTGAAFGLSIFLAGLAGLLFSTKSFFRAKTVLFGIVLSGLLVLFTLANWGLGKPWEISWSVQERTFDALRARKSEFEKIQTVMLMNCPRYVNASPVLDGTWDFEELLHLALGRSDIKGGVVSERLILGKDCLQDVSFGFACAEYPLKNFVLVTPGLAAVRPIVEPKQFINVVENEGMLFGLSPSTLDDWKRQLTYGTRKKKNGVLAPLKPPTNANSEGSEKEPI